MNICHYQTVIGTICMAEENGALVGLYKDENGSIEEDRETTLLRETNRQLTEYLNKKRQVFDLPINLKGTDFQTRVWNALQQIPYGETWSYGELAKYIGQPKASRAVGGANHNNPIMIIVPCHRVIGADGSLVGFGGGLDMKKFLLELEQGK